MNTIRISVAAAASSVILALCGPASAAPVDFSVTPNAFTPGSGYGTGVGDLDVSFAVTGGPNTFSLASPGDAQTFAFGSVKMNETTLIGAGETDNLGVSATFEFFDPLAGSRTITAFGTATIGALNDIDIDLNIDWDPMVVAFGAGGSFLLDMNSLNFRFSGQSIEQAATIRLLSAPTTAVPEPATLALVGLALVGVGVSRRMRRA